MTTIGAQKHPPLVSRLLAYLDAGPDVERRARQLARAGVAATILLGIPELPRAKRDALREAVDASVVASLRAEHTSVWVSQTLTDRGIRHVHLKGHVLARAWEFGWSTPAARTWGDVDLLVNEHDVPRALDALAQRGQVVAGPATGSQLTVSTPHRGTLDLHWQMLNDHPVVARHHLSTKRILAEHVLWQGLSGRLDAEMALAHTAMHALISNLTRPSALFDIDATARDPALDWSKLASLLDAHRLRLPVGVGLAAAAYWLDTPVPKTVQLRGSMWASLCNVTQRRDPAKHLDRGWTGAEVFRLTRQNDAASFAALLMAIPLEIRVQRRIRGQR